MKKKLLIVSIVVIVLLVVGLLLFTKGNISSVKSKIKSNYDIVEASQNITPKIRGCEIALKTDIKRIVRAKEDKKIELLFSAKCGDEVEEIKTTGTIKKSPYTYTATANENMQNYDLTIQKDGKNIKTVGGVYNMDGDWLSDIIDGKAIINNMDINGYPDYQVLFEDKNPIFVITKK